MNNIDSITSGTITPTAIANIDWILIPTADAGGKDEAGVPYYVEAFIRYSVNGVQYRINSTQEKIMVMPQPNLCLNYYIPEKVKAYTPFKLALEVNNTGYGTARNFQIESAQPVIYENLAELLIDFKLLGSTMMGENVTPSLKINFGNIPPGTTKLGYWTMATTLDGNFTEFNASYTHSDALGGAKTSLISCVKTNILTHDVNTGSVTNDFLIDTNGDKVPDGILNSATGTHTVVTPTGHTVEYKGNEFDPKLIVGVDKPNGWIFIDVEDIFGDKVEIVKIMRPNGSELIPTNYWRINGRLYIADDPATEYTIVYQSTGGPKSVTELHNISYANNYINWSWLDPDDTDFDHVEVYVNGTFKENVTKGVQYYNAVGLLPDTEYELSTRTANATNYVNLTWVNHTARTAATSSPSDSTPPVITNISVSGIGTNSTVISWQTDEASTSSVRYGNSSGSYTNTIASSDMISSHSFNLSGLSPDMMYYYVVGSADANGNSAQSSEFNFKTLALIDMIKPTIASVGVYPSNTTAGSKVDIKVAASDNIGVTGVTANGTAFTYSDGYWKGNITASSSLGKYNVLIKANDAAGNNVTTK
jgi:hypothetical protein